MSAVEASVAVIAGEWSATVAHPDVTAECVPNPVPSWHTVVSISSLVTGAFTVQFSDAVPVGGGILYWSLLP